jgi:hypothetical protein
MNQDDLQRSSSVGHFFVADLSAQGELRQVNEYERSLLELIPGARDLISTFDRELGKHTDELEVPLGEERKAFLRWRSTAPSAGIATVRRSSGELVSLSLLLAGRDAGADAATIDVLQKHLVRELKQTPFEPGFDLVHLEQRPLLATMTFATDAAGDRMLEALADRSFAAAYFQSLALS